MFLTAAVLVCAGEAGASATRCQGPRGSHSPSGFSDFAWTAGCRGGKARPAFSSSPPDGDSPRQPGAPARAAGTEDSVVHSASCSGAEAAPLGSRSSSSRAECACWVAAGLLTRSRAEKAHCQWCRLSCAQAGAGRGAGTPQQEAGGVAPGLGSFLSRTEPGSRSGRLP